jgi:thiamine biosynthesis lipoprotein
LIVRMAEYRVEHVMGMAVAIDVRDEIPSGAVDETVDWFRRVDRMFSPYRDDSEISRIARRTATRQMASPPVREVLAQCDRLRAQTGGFFDPLATGRLDPSGFVKGWAVERAAELLDQAGATRLAVNAGGDAVVRGDLPWRVGIQHPIDRQQLAAVVELRDAAIATSGAYERGTHVINPHDGRPARGLLSVTVVGSDLGVADAYATAAFAMGREAPEWLAAVEGYDALAILDDLRVLCTPGFLALCPGGSPAASLCSSPDH